MKLEVRYLPLNHAGSATSLYMCHMISGDPTLPAGRHYLPPEPVCLSHATLMRRNITPLSLFVSLSSTVSVVSKRVLQRSQHRAV